MSTTLAVLLVGCAGFVLLVALAAVRGRGHGLVDPVDPAPADHWLVERVAERPAWRRLLTHLDRRVVGGVAVAVSGLVVLGAALFVGWIFDSIDSGSGFAQWDESVAAWGTDHASDTTVTVMRAVTHLGGTAVLAVIIAIVALVDWRRRGHASGAWFLITVGVGVVIINNGLKLWIMRDRPPVDHLVGAAGSSFPSGHSSAAAACWLALALVIGRWTPRAARVWITAAAVGIACLVAASRAVLGVHWLTDVIAGVTVGWAWCFLVAIAFGPRLDHLGEPVEEIAAADAAADAATDRPDAGADRHQRMNGARHG